MALFTITDQTRSADCRCIVCACVNCACALAASDSRGNAGCACGPDCTCGPDCRCSRRA